MKYWKIGLGLALVLAFFCLGAVAQSSDALIFVDFDGAGPYNGKVEVYEGGVLARRFDGTGSDNVRVAAGAELSVRFVPNTGYRLINGTQTTSGGITASCWYNPVFHEYFPINRDDTSFPMRGSCITIDEEYIFIIAFEPDPDPAPPPAPTYQVLTNVTPSDGGTVTGAGWYNEGASVTCAFTPKEGFYLSGESSCTYGAAQVLIPEGSRDVEFTMPAQEVTVNAVFKSWDGLIDLDVSGALITDSNITYNGVTYPLAGLKLRARGKTKENNIVVESGSHTLYLNGASADMSNVTGASGIQVRRGASLDLLLNPGTKNSFMGGDYAAGIGAGSGAAITIGCAGNGGHNHTNNCGELTATGGDRGAGLGGGERGGGGTITIEGGAVKANGGNYGAGIGGGFYNNGTTTTIKGGTVTATGGIFGAGIGGGERGGGGAITIEGGTVKANGGNYGAGIGGGFYNNGGTTTIKGGTVTATGGDRGAGLGGGEYGGGGNITIEGGTVTANGSGGGAGLGGGYEGGDGNITITGGSVNAGMSARPVNAENSPVYRVAARLDGAGAAVISGITATSGGVGLKYGMNDVRTDKNGYIYLYLPLGARLTEALSGKDVYRGSINALRNDSASGTLEKGLRMLIIKTTELGKATTSDEKDIYKPGASVTLMFTPAKYPAKNLVIAYVQKGSYYEYTLNEQTQRVDISDYENEYTFDMPDADVTVTPVFEEDLVFDGNIDLAVSGAVLKDDSIKYNGETYKLSKAIELTAIGETNKNNIVVESGSHTLYLNGASADMSNVKGASGILINSGASLDLRLNSGTNNAFAGGEDAAGIGAGSGATLTIGCAGRSGHNHTENCGKLTATGGADGAGLGGGYVGGGGSITITGGTVTATGGNQGAGLGGGSGGNGGTIRIEGGAVTANGGDEGAGLGGGINGNGGTIKIEGGTVTATGKSGGAGLGGGNSRGGGGGDGGTITIAGGTVTANGNGGGAGLGGGSGGDGGNITITGGTVTASSARGGAGIGYYGGGSSVNSTVAITGGSVNAHSIHPQPKNADTTDVYKMTVNFDPECKNARISGLPLKVGYDEYDYGIDDVKTDKDGYLYVYAPEGAALSSIALSHNGLVEAYGSITANRDNSASATFTHGGGKPFNYFPLTTPGGELIIAKDLFSALAIAQADWTVSIARDTIVNQDLAVPYGVNASGKGAVVFGSLEVKAGKSRKSVEPSASGIIFEGEASGWRLKNPGFVEVSAFLPGDSGKGIIATLYFDKYVVGSQVLTGVMDGSDIHKRFVIGNGKKYALDELGRLVKKAKQFGDFVFVIDELVLQPGMKAKVANILPPDFVGDVKWASSDADVLGVQKKKTLKAVAVGSATLNATRADGAEIELPVRVVEKGTVVKNITLPKSTPLAIGGKTRLTPTLKPDTALETTLFWLSADERIATVDDGYVTALRAGKTKVYVFSSSGRRAATTVNVKSTKLESWTLSDAELTLTVGELRRLVATVTPSDADQSVKWKSNKPKIASVTDGIITALKPGKATITCTFANGKKVKCKVVVE